MWTDNARRSSSVQLSSASWASRARRKTSSALVYAPLERRLLISVSRSGGRFNCMATLRFRFFMVKPFYHEPQTAAQLFLSQRSLALNDGQDGPILERRLLLSGREVLSSSLLGPAPKA